MGSTSNFVPLAVCTEIVKMTVQDDAIATHDKRDMNFIALMLPMLK